MTRKVAIVAGVLLFGVVSEGKDLELASAWASAPVKVDGSAEDWSALLKPLGDEPVVIGVRNDADFLYLCVKTSDLKIKKQFGMVGLTVWANGDGKDKKGFGVRFPVAEGTRHLGADGGRQGRSPGDGPGGTPSDGGQPPPPVSEEGRPRAAGPRPVGFELIGPSADDRLRVPAGSDERVAAAQGDDSGVMVLEFRIPLKGTDAHPLAIGAAPGATIAVGLETERPKPAKGQAERGSGVHGGEPIDGPPGGPHGGPGGGYGGGYGGPGGMGGGYGGGRHSRGGMGDGGREIGSPMRIWLRVALATPPAAPASQDAGVKKP